MPVQTIRWSKDKVRIIDQTRLPGRVVYIGLKTPGDVWHAVKELKVRGAPAIGVAAAFGVLLGIKGHKGGDKRDFFKKTEKVISYLASSRPTAANLFWALNRMKKCAAANAGESVAQIKKAMLKEAMAIMREDMDACRRMAVFGSRLIKNGDNILTHCNTGGLATVDYGTALGAIFKAKKDGKKIRVYVDETRPLLQGSRLTAWELLREGIDTTLICDNMAASLMAQGMIDKVFVGADRIAGNGDTANKIGTYNIAVLAHYHKVPFYVVAPFSSFHAGLRSGTDIPIEYRKESEVKAFMGRQSAPRAVRAYNPAFDVTPHGLITAIVTEKGILRGPFGRAIRGTKR